MSSHGPSREEGSMQGFDAQITFVFVRQLERSHVFYAEVLGLDLVVDQGSCRIYRTAGEAYLGLCQRPDACDPQGVILCLVADDVDGWAERLERHGVSLEKRPAANPTYGIYHLFARDPDGWLVEIQRFDDPSWAG